MPFDPHANGAYSLVATAPTPATSGTSLVVTVGTGSRFPSSFSYNCAVWPSGTISTSANTEYVRVTGRTTDTLTITRTQESGINRAIVAGDQIALVASKKTFTDIETALSGALVLPQAFSITDPSLVTSDYTFATSTKVLEINDTIDASGGLGVALAANYIIAAGAPTSGSAQAIRGYLESAAAVDEVYGVFGQVNVKHASILGAAGVLAIVRGVPADATFDTVTGGTKSWEGLRVAYEDISGGLYHASVGIRVINSSATKFFRKGLDVQAGDIGALLRVLQNAGVGLGIMTKGVGGDADQYAMILDRNYDTVGQSQAILFSGSGQLEAAIATATAAPASSVRNEVISAGVYGIYLSALSGSLNDVALFTGTGRASLSGHLRVGSMSTPTHTTAGDLEAVRLFGQPARTDGWVDADESWAYASATTITVPTGAASRYGKGDKIRLVQTTTKYFSVVAVADTVLTVTGGADYTVANAAITAPYYSHEENPLGFPLLTWTPGYTGFSANPTTLTAKFRVEGSTVEVYYTQNALGTSNATTFTITGLPIAIASAVTVGPFLAFGANNGANVLTPLRVDISSTTVTLGIDVNQVNTWANANAKGVYGFVFKYIY